MNLLRYVNPLQGTDSHVGFSTGNTEPLVALPFGMAHWMLQTGDGWGWQFDPHNRKLQGIRCTHQPSPWMGDYGAFAIMPQSGPRYVSAGKRATSYRLDRSVIKPHLLTTEIASSGVRIEMAPTERCAVFRFTFPEGAPSRIIFEAAGGETFVSVREDRRTVVGYTRGNSGGVTEGFANHFVAVLDRDVTFWTPFKHDDLWIPEQPATDEKIGLCLELGEEGGPVVMRVATSFICAEQAELNLRREVGNATLEEIAARGEAIWEEALGRIQIEEEDEAKLATFYSCLYRTQLFPRIWHEINAAGETVHHSPYDGGVHPGVLYADTGFWDTYRTQFPLMTLLQPDLMADILRGFVTAYKESGWFPQWPSPGHRSCMPGTHLDATIADAVAKGITDFDVETALDGMLKHAEREADLPGAGRPNISEYLAHGYCVTTHRAVAHTLDYAYDDWCISRVAGILGHLGTERRLLDRSQNFRYLYDPSVGFMRQKDAQHGWVEPFDEFAWGGPYCEGGAWQSLWAVPHDPEGLMRLMGGPNALAAKLDKMLETPPYFKVGGYSGEIHEMTEMAMADFGQYAHSNQPVHNALFFYLTAGRPDRLQKEVRRVMDELYTPDVFPGDEDNGEMAAWYILNALGLYPRCPGDGLWSFGSPLFKRARVKLPNGNELTIEAPENGPGRVYVKDATWQGEAIEGHEIAHQTLAAGGVLRFEMSDSPES
ncbi:GH92 family glycosyl hydrolase [soil metagenome]